MSKVSAYYESEAQLEFARTVAGAGVDVTGQPAFSATYEITGEGGGAYGLRIANGLLEIVPGGIPGSDMRVVAAVSEWLQGADAGFANPFYYYSKRKVNLIKSLKGTVSLDLSQDDGDNLEGAIIFGDTGEPTVTLRMKAADYLAMLNGKLNGQMAFMTGKLKFDGSLPLLMQLAALNR
ncbi:MAG: SCP2 sterol-binding domain-containing protein [Roseiflexaceae bacterium]|nr:SCP2 sterol-binding domain-containing protein [Roseiflexaceae bacterium]